MTLIEVFVLLQVLDLVTTLAGLRLGGAELNPFITSLMQITEPAIGLIVAKMVAFGMGGFFIWKHQTRLIRRINYVFAVLVVWNAANIISTLI